MEVKIVEIIDLTHTIHNEIQIYPGDPVPSISRGLIHEKDYCHVDILTLGSHTGTHIDAPYHFLKDGKKIDAIPIQRFVGSGILIDVSDKSERDLIESHEVEPYKPKIEKGDFVIFMTGWDKYFGTPKYFEHPFLSADCAGFLVELGVTLVGTDGMNLDPTFPEDTDPDPEGEEGEQVGYGYPVHDILLGSDVLIVENLCNLDKINRVKGIYSFLPLKLMDSDGSPIRAVYLSDK